MKIKEIEIRPLPVPLKTTFKTALRSVDLVQNIMVLIRTDTKHVGVGAAAPVTAITGETDASVMGAVGMISESLAGMDLADPEAVFQRLDACIVGNPSAKAGVDMAVYDLWAKSLDIPVFRLLGGKTGDLATDLTVSLDSPKKMAADGREAAGRGFDVLKIKVGNDPDLDISRLSAIHRAVGPDVGLCMDANQGWTPKQAVKVGRELEKRGIDILLMEQPVHAKDFAGLKFVRDNCPFPVYADESVFSPADALKLVSMEAVDGLNIKLMKCGGIRNALAIADLARAAGLPCMIGSMMETAVSVTAAAHLAVSRPVIQHFDLDAPLFCAASPARGGMAYDGPKIILPDTPGLGLEPKA